MHRQGEAHTYLPGKTLGMVFQHPSTRTRVSFEAGMAQLGGTAIYLGVNDLQLRRGETVSDTAKVLGRYVDVLVARVKLHSDIQELAANAGIPVINGLSDQFHPTQALADLLTLQENFGRLHGLKIAYVGDGNNVAVSLMLAAAAVGVSVRMANPVGIRAAGRHRHRRPPGWRPRATPRSRSIAIRATPSAAPMRCTPTCMFPWEWKKQPPARSRWRPTKSPPS